VATRVRARVWSSGICGGQSGAGTGFLRVLRCPLPIFIPPNFLSSQSPGAEAADVPSKPSMASTPHYANYGIQKLLVRVPLGIPTIMIEIF
jgi:hypothetical protein